MAATINGKPSVFLTPVTPVPVIDQPTYFADPENIDFFARPPLPTIQEQLAETDRKMAEAHRQAEAEWLADEEAQREYQEWSDSLYNTPEAQAELDAWCDEQERQAELTSLGDAGLHAIAGHDARWQAGGQI